MPGIELDPYPFTKDDQPFSPSFDEPPKWDEERISTAFGYVKVTIYGDRSKMALVTFHDLGLDSESNFQNFFQFALIAEFADKFCIYNINAPGQEMDAAPLPENFQYPSMEGLAKIIENVADHFKLKTFFGFGVGLGANVFLRFAILNQNRLNALILINCVHTKAGWVEWGHQKMNMRHLRAHRIASSVVDYLMWHHFGDQYNGCSVYVIRHFRTHFQQLTSPTNLAMLIESYINRTVINLPPENSSNVPQFKVPVLQLVGAGSAFLNKTVDLSALLNPAKSDWVKIPDSCGLVLDDRPDAVIEALILFFQGLGYFPTLNLPKLMKHIQDAQSDDFTVEQAIVDEC